MNRSRHLLWAAMRLGLALLCTAAFAGYGTCDDTPAVPALAAQPAPPAAVAQTMTIIIDAITNNNYQQFMASAPFEDAFKTAMTPAVFTKVCDQFAPRLKGGYSLHYLDALSEKGYATHLWKLSFNDKSDDVLVELSIKGGKVGGLFIL